MSEEIRKLASEWNSGLLALNEKLDKQAKDGGVIKDEIQKTHARLDEIEAKAKDLEETTKGIVFKSGDKVVKADKGYVLEEAQAAFNDAIRKNRADGLYCKDLFEGDTGSNGKGGITVPELVMGIYMDNLRKMSPIREQATVTTISTDKLERLVDPGRFGATWVAELSARPTTGTTTFNRVFIPLHEIYSFPQATRTLLQDSAYDLEGHIMNQVVFDMAAAESDKFVNGDGVGTPTGLLSVSAWADNTVYEFGKVGHYTTAASASVTLDDVIDLQEELRQAYNSNAVWIMNQTTRRQLRKVKQTQTYAWEPNSQAGAAPTLLGRPVVIADHMPSPGSGNKVVLYGDFAKSYQIVDHAEVTMMRDELTNKPFIGFYITRRTGGAPVQFDSYKILQCAV